MICVYLERPGLDLEGELNHKVFMRREKDFIYRLALCQSLRQLVPKCRPLEEGRGTAGHTYEWGSSRDAVGGRGGGFRERRPQMQQGRGFPLEGSSVLIFPPENGKSRGLVHGASGDPEGGAAARQSFSRNCPEPCGRPTAQSPGRGHPAVPQGPAAPRSSLRPGRLAGSLRCWRGRDPSCWSPLPLPGSARYACLPPVWPTALCCHEARDLSRANSHTSSLGRPPGRLTHTSGCPSNVPRAPCTQRTHA